MESFCHQSTKPRAFVHVKLDGEFLMVTIILSDGLLSINVDTRGNPRAKILLAPCDKVTLFVQERSISIQVDGENIIKNASSERMDARDALQELGDSFCKLSKSHAELIMKRRDAKDVKDEAFQCLAKLDEERKADFTKFVLILNEKKRKIRELQRKLGTRDDDPEEIEDDIGVLVGADGGSVHSKEPKVSDQLQLLERPSASKTTSQEQHDNESASEREENIDDSYDEGEEELMSDVHSERAPSEIEEIDEDAGYTSPVKRKRSPRVGDQDPPPAGNKHFQLASEEILPMKSASEIKKEIQEEKLSEGSSEDSEAGYSGSARPTADEADATKNTGLDALDALL